MTEFYENVMTQMQKSTDRAGLTFSICWSNALFYATSVTVAETFVIVDSVMA